MTLDEYAKDLLEPAVKRLEARLGKTRKQIIEDAERELAPFRRIMSCVRRSSLDES